MEHYAAHKSYFFRRPRVKPKRSLLWVSAQDFRPPFDAFVTKVVSIISLVIGPSPPRPRWSIFGRFLVSRRVTFATHLRNIPPVIRRNCPKIVISRSNPSGLDVF